MNITLPGVDVNNLNVPPHIQTASGYYINFLDFTNNVYSIYDIAHALSNQCRFTGHTRTFYSVAQHSVWCSYQVPRHLAMLALLHDAQEAYVGDCSTPLKQLLPNFRIIEDALQKDIFRVFDLDTSEYTTVKAVDYMALKREQFHLMPGFDVEGEVEAFLQQGGLVPECPKEARSNFLKRYVELGGKHDFRQATDYTFQKISFDLEEK